MRPNESFTSPAGKPYDLTDVTERLHLAETRLAD
jgi:hypothetical protein